MEIDVRNGNQSPSVDALRYTDKAVIKLNDGKDKIIIQNTENGNQVVACVKGDIDHMICALQTAKKVWFSV